MPLRSSLLIALLAVPLAVGAQTATDVSLLAPDGTTVAIDRDDYGVPHITAETEAAVFFGQGFATGQDRLFQLETFWRTATGRLAELQGSAALAQDQGIRTVFYTPDERAAQFDALTPRLQTMIASYVDGINAYIDSTAADPATYLPVEYAVGGFTPEPYTVDKAMAVMQFFIRRFGEIGGNELTRLAELQANGTDWFEANRPVNDPTASVTIEASSQAPQATGSTYAGPPVDPAVAAAVERQRAAMTDGLIANGVPHKFGSFAAVVSGAMSESGHVLLLGAPQMGQPRVDSKAVTAEYELLVGAPEGDGLHVAGMSVPGIPGVIIGRTRGRTWTFTTGATDNTDTFTLTLGPPTAQGIPTYLVDGAFVPAEPVTSTINVAGGSPVTYTSFRTAYGPVYSIDAANGRAYAYKYAFENEELEMAEALLDAWDATSIDEFRAAAARIPVSFNMFYADQEQNIAYWHVGQYPIRPGDADPRLPLQGDGSQDWLGLTDFAQHPQSENPAQGYFANWNNKPVAWWNQGDNVRWTSTSPGGYHRYYDGVEVLKDHLESVGAVSFEELQELTRVVRTNAQYPEYPATYQQVVEFAQGGSDAENVIPPGQSGFVNAAGVPSANFADQWAFYESSAGTGEIEMKPFTFIGAQPVAAADSPIPMPAFGLPFPNPTARAATVVVRLDAPAEVEVAVFDALGRRVALAASGPHPAGEHAVTIDASAFAPGVYVVRLATGGAVQSRRLVVAR
ncbi:penicillin acylase family protein [Rubrivirga sp. IMCC43871]|uniref:penicillin acylase family protein n=1 Tax=Rubrivirga sp. IMCC43871 TaxID=3391575 RepID=UPI00398FDF9D